MCWSWVCVGPVHHRADLGKTKKEENLSRCETRSGEHRQAGLTGIAGLVPRCHHRARCGRAGHGLVLPAARRDFLVFMASGRALFAALTEPASCLGPAG
jgi:hypothetical protein